MADDCLGACFMRLGPQLPTREIELVPDDPLADLSDNRARALTNQTRFTGIYSEFPLNIISIKVA